MSISMKPGTCTARHNYRISYYTRNAPCYAEQNVNYTCGVFSLAGTGRFVAYESQLQENDLLIEIEGCKNEHGQVEPWMGDTNANFYTSLADYLEDQCVLCEICDNILKAKVNP